MDQVNGPNKSATETLDFMIETQAEMEKLLTDFRKAYAEEIHPWALNPLANAIGSIQACQSHLKAAKDHIETPEPQLPDDPSTVM